MPQKRALVLGGTGHIGSAIARQLDLDGYRVIATGRRAGDRPNLLGTNVQIALGDDTSPGVAENWIKQTDLVVDAATPYPIWLHGHNTPVAEAVARTHRLLEAVSKTGAGFVHISSFTTLPRPTGAVTQIGQGILRGMHSYFDVKQQVEDAVRKALLNGQRGCIVNPSTCFGPYDLKPDKQAFVPMLLAGKVGGLVHHDMNVVDVRDVADIVGLACTQGFPHRQIPVFGHNIPLGDLAQKICQIGGAPPPRMKVPSVLGLAGLYWTETALAITGHKTPWPSLPMMLVSASYSASASPEQTALLPRMRPLDTTLHDAVSWYQSLS